VPILLIILLAILVAQVGFWDSLAALFGAVGIVILFFLVLAAVVAIGAYLLFRRVWR
jgi:uncharacterized membrane protein YkvI